MKSIDPPDEQTRTRGRPRRGNAPDIPWPTVDRVLVFGEREVDPKTGAERLKYPSLAVVAKRYGVTQTTIWKYAHKARCFERRAEARLKAVARSDELVIEKIANASAKAAVDVATIVDTFIAQFHRSLDEGKVRADSPADLDRLVRLKELLRGGADARVEMQGGLTLEAIQSRHRVLRGQVAQLTPAVTGTNDAGPPDIEGVERPRVSATDDELAELDGEPSSGEPRDDAGEAASFDDEACGSPASSMADPAFAEPYLAASEADDDGSASAVDAAGGVR